MKKLMTICVVAGLTLVVSNPATAMITVDPDVFTDGTDISTAVAGVTLSSFGTGRWISIDGLVYARNASDPTHASTGTKVFGNNLSGTDGAGDPYSELWYKGASDEFRLRADFDNLANYVAIDMIGNNAIDYGILEAYNSSGTLLASVTSPNLTDGNPWTAAISLASFDIAYVISSGTSGSTIYLDNLNVNMIPAPGAILLGSIGVGLIGWLRRRRTL